MKNNNLLTLDAGLFHFKANDITLIRGLLKNKSGIYTLYNPLTHNYYIGSSSNLWNRIIDYMR